MSKGRVKKKSPYEAAAARLKVEKFRLNSFYSGKKPVDKTPETTPTPAGYIGPDPEQYKKLLCTTVDNMTLCPFWSRTSSGEVVRGWSASIEISLY